jgi:hypothetical protein
MEKEVCGNPGLATGGVTVPGPADVSSQDLNAARGNPASRELKRQFRQKG